MHAIRTRLSLSFAVIIIGTLGLFLAAVHLAAVSAIETQIAAQMRTSVAMFRADWMRQQRQMAQVGSVLAQDFGFRAAVATGDRATIESALANVARRSGLSAVVLIGADGTLISQGPPLSRKERAVMDAAVARDARSGLLRLGGQDMQAQAVPVRAPQPIATLVIARPLGQPQIAAFLETTSIALDARIVRRSGHARHPDAALRTENRREDGSTLILDHPLPDFGAQGHMGGDSALQLSYPIDRAFAHFRPIQVTLGVISAAALAAALLASWYLARDITGPLRALRDAAARLSRGEAAQVQKSGCEEIGDLADSFNRMVQAVEEREARITQLYRLACHDAMTGLPNRTVLNEALMQLLADGERHGQAGVFFIDIDGFKQVNDRLGHAAGDTLIRRFADRCSILLGDALLARMGGDEFAALVPGDWTQLRAIAETLVAAAMRPFDLDGHAVLCGASIGIAIVGDDGLTPDRMLHHADIALYAAKAAGKGCCRFYHEGRSAPPPPAGTRPALRLVKV